MARNEEKQLGRLNRLHLKQQRDDENKKNPKRPRLDVIHTADDIKQWLPSIKKDIDFCLKQSEVPCYPESKIKEFNQNIDKLQGEYKAFVRKLRKLDTSIKETPWTERGYRKGKEKRNEDISANIENGQPWGNQDTANDKTTALVALCQHTDTSQTCELGDGCSEPSCQHKHVETGSQILSGDSNVKKSYSSQVSCNSVNSLQNTNRQMGSNLTTSCEGTDIQFTPIATPILHNDAQYRTMYGYTDKDIVNDYSNNVNLEIQDKPLSFVKNIISGKSDKNIKTTVNLGNKGDNLLSTLLPYSDSSDEND